MPTLPADTMKQMRERHRAIEALMAEGGDADAYVRLSSEYAELSPVVARIAELENAREELDGLRELLADPEMKEIAQGEIPELEERIERAEADLQLLLLPKDSADERNVILEVRAGTGGSEAGLFAGDLFRMYSRYAEEKGWKVEVMSRLGGRGRRLQGDRRQHRRAGGLRAGSSSSPASTACSAYRKPRAAGASTPPRRRSPCCPKRRRWTSRSGPRTSASTRCARRAQAGSTSTPRIPPCASRTSRQARS